MAGQNQSGRYLFMQHGCLRQARLGLYVDKSVFFILAASLLLSLAGSLNRRKKQFLEEVEEGKHHD